MHAHIKRNMTHKLAKKTTTTTTHIYLLRQIVVHQLIAVENFSSFNLLSFWSFFIVAIAVDGVVVFCFTSVVGSGPFEWWGSCFANRLPNRHYLMSHQHSDLIAHTCKKWYATTKKNYVRAGSGHKRFCPMRLLAKIRWQIQAHSIFSAVWHLSIKWLG